MTIKNTLVITSLKLVVCFPAPIILALLLNEVKAERFKKTVQTLSYLPNFVSWVVVVQLMTTIFTPYGGIFNDIRQMMGKEAIFVMGEKNAFLPLVVFSDLWKNVGWALLYIWLRLPVLTRDYTKRRQSMARDVGNVPGTSQSRISVTIGITVHYGSRRHAKCRL